MNLIIKYKISLIKVDRCGLKYGSFKSNPPYHIVEIDNEFLKCLEISNFQESIKYGVSVYQSYCNWKGKRFDTQAFQVHGNSAEFTIIISHPLGYI